MPILYTALASAQAGREGRVRSDDGAIDLQLSVPSGIGGAGGTGTNPEQLFAAGYAACFGSALRAVAEKQEHTVSEPVISASVSLQRNDNGEFDLAVTLTGRFPDLNEDDAKKLMRAAHEVCPYSRAIRGNVDVELDVDVRARNRGEG